MHNSNSIHIGCRCHEDTEQVDIVPQKFMLSPPEGKWTATGLRCVSMSESGLRSVSEVWRSTVACKIGQRRGGHGWIWFHYRAGLPASSVVSPS